MAKLVDEIVDVALMIRGIRDAREADDRLPFIMSRLEAAALAVRRLKPGRRRMPGLDHALDWVYRAAAEVPMGDDRRVQVDAAIAEVKVLVGATGREKMPGLRSQV